jgi:ribosomal-protein-alanine N-acetyltransferase
VTTLRTERLLLREFVDADWPAVHAYGSDPQVVEFVPWGPNTQEDTRAFVRRAIGHQAETPRRSYELAVVLRDQSALVGGCGLTVTDPQNRSGSIGYVLHRRYWGRGLMPEAARALLRFGFGELGLHRIWALCDVQNARSARVLEKIGMQREACMKQDAWMHGRWRDTYLYAVLENEWHAAPCMARAGEEA